LIVLTCLLLTSVNLAANCCQACNTSRVPLQLVWGKLQKTQTRGIVDFIIMNSNIIIVFVAPDVTNAGSTSRYAITAFTPFYNS
jgi:hypothetical protein